MKKIICIILACLMIAVCFAFVSCSKNEENKADAGGETKEATIVGKWEMKLSGDTFGAAFGEGVNFTGEVKAYVTFGEDGKYTTEVDEDSYRAFMKGNLSAICGAMGASVEDLMTMTGASSEDELLDYLLSQDEDSENMDESGEYTFEDGVLTMKSSEGESKIKAELNGNSLVWKEIISEEEGASFANESVLPLTLTRVG